MDKILDKKFTTSQFAAMHNINKRTLMYYDDIGLFSPDEVKSNGYRYYTFRQNMLFSTILLLRKMHVSLKDIAKYIKNYTQKNLLDLLRGQDRILDEKIKELLWLQKIVRNKINNIETKDGIEFSSIKVQDEEEATIVVSQEVADLPVEKIVPLAASFIGDCYKYRAYCGYPMGLIFEGAALIDTNERKIKNFFFIFDEKEKSLPVCIKPAGRYLVGYYKGNWADLPLFYGKMTGYAQEHSLNLGKNVYEERVIDDIAARSMDYIELKISIELA